MSVLAKEKHYICFILHKKGCDEARSSSPEVFLEKGVLKLLCNFIEITLWHGRSTVNLLPIFRNLEDNKFIL